VAGPFACWIAQPQSTGNLTVTGTGNPAASIRTRARCNAPDQNAAEEAVDYACWESPVRGAFCIGGGVKWQHRRGVEASHRRAHRHVELDPALIDMGATSFFPAQFAPLVSDLGSTALRGWPVLSEEQLATGSTQLF